MCVCVCVCVLIHICVCPLRSFGQHRSVVLIFERTLRNLFDEIALFVDVMVVFVYLFTLCVCMCVCVCMDLFGCISMVSPVVDCECVCLCACVHKPTCTFQHISKYLCLCVFVCVCVYVCMRMHITLSLHCFSIDCAPVTNLPWVSVNR